MPFNHGFSTSALLRPLGFAGRRSHSRVWSPGTSKGPPFRSATNATRALADSRCARVRSSPADCASFRPRRARPGDLRAFQLGRDGGLLRFLIDQQRANHHRLEQQHDLVAVRVVRLELGAPGSRPRSNSVPRSTGRSPTSPGPTPPHHLNVGLLQRQRRVVVEHHRPSRSSRCPKRLAVRHVCKPIVATRAAQPSTRTACSASLSLSSLP